MKKRQGSLYLLSLIFIAFLSACSGANKGAPQGKLGKMDISKSLEDSDADSGKEASSPDGSHEAADASKVAKSSGSDPGKALGSTADDVKTPTNPDLTPVGNPQPLPNPTPPVVVIPLPPPPPPPTHKVTVDCNQALNMRFEFGGRMVPFRIVGGTINGNPADIVTSHCPKIKAALDQKGFPMINKPASMPRGGDGLSASCDSTSLNLRYLSGNPQEGGTGFASAQGVDIESVDVCLEIRNIINALMLKNSTI